MRGPEKSASLAGKANGSLPEGLTTPKRTLASAVPPSMPQNQYCTIALASWTQGIWTGYAEIDDHGPGIGRQEGFDQLVLPGGQP